MKTMPVRIKRERTRGWKMPDNTVYVGRGSAWGNPFKVGVDGDAKTCVKKFYDDFLPYQHGKGTMEEFLKSEANLKSLHPLRGKNLACWCSLDDICHADVLLRLANEGHKHD